MSFPKQFLDELKARIPVSDVVGRRVRLQKRGREFVGLSPFTNEKTPSFTVNDEKQFYHCFSSGEHGDIITFLEKTEGLSFLEAVERLAGEAGLEMPKRDPREAQREKQRAGLQEIVEMAQGYFREAFEGGEGREARDYAERRGLTRQTIETFGIGFAPDARTGLRDHLKAKGVTVAEMAAAGLVIAGDDIAEPYDRFRNRLMFPIHDARGRTIAFGGRALDPDARAKYLNSPETELFHKGSVLYNLHRARTPAHDQGTVLVAEGYMDVVALAQAGFSHAVAPLGTALTERQMALLWRIAPEPVLCFDGDRAGLGAAYRAVERALPELKPGHSLRFAFLPQGQDPDDLLKVSGPDAMQQVIDAARPLADILWEKEAEAQSLDTPERRARFETRLEALVGTIADQKVRGHYGQDMAERLRALFRPARSGSGTAAGRFFSRSRQSDRRRGRYEPQAPVSPELKRLGAARQEQRQAEELSEALIVMTVLNHPSLLDRHAETLAEIDIRNPELDKLRNEIIDLAAHHAPLDVSALKNHLDRKGLTPAVARWSQRIAVPWAWFAASGAAPGDAETGWQHVLSRHRKASTLKAELNDAERALAEDMTEENLARLKAVKAALERQDGSEAALEGFGERSGRSP